MTHKSGMGTYYSEEMGVSETHRYHPVKWPQMGIIIRLYPLSEILKPTYSAISDKHDKIVVFWNLISLFNM